MGHRVRERGGKAGGRTPLGGAFVGCLRPRAGQQPVDGLPVRDAGRLEFYSDSWEQSGDEFPGGLGLLHGENLPLGDQAASARLQGDRAEIVKTRRMGAGHIAQCAQWDTLWQAPGPISVPIENEQARKTVEIPKLAPKEGQVLCIIEAMKLMNEIKAESAGIVVKFLVENTQPVEFGQPLYILKP